MHIGLIGGIGPAATELYYRGLVARHAAAKRPMELTIVHADVHDLARNAGEGAAQRQAEIFLGYVRRLQAAGAEAAAITSIGGHFCVRELEAFSPLPILNAIPAVVDWIRASGHKTIGLLGTRTVMQSRLYGGITSASVVVPAGAALDAVHDNYVAMALSSRVTDAQRSALFAAGASLVRDQGADLVMLAGTDLFLAFDGRDCGFPVVDASDIHMDALTRASIGAG